MKITTAENGKKVSPLWEFISIADYHLPAAPVTQSLRERLTVIQRLFRREEPEQSSPFKAKDKLKALPQWHLERVAPDPEWHSSAGALDIELKDWLGQEKPDPPVIFMVGPPHGGHTEILTAWAERQRWPVLSPPSTVQILAGDDTWTTKQSGDGSPWVFPALERAYLRHAEGLNLIRRFLARAHAGDLGRGIIGCDSWAWAYLRHVWHDRLSHTLTVQACDQSRLADHFQRLADPSGDRQLVFQQSDNGRYVLPLPDSDVAPRETSNFLELLAAQSRGILGVALAIWCTSLRTEPDEDIAKKDDAAEHEIHGQTVWVIPWNQVVLPELPGGAGRDEAFLMHTLLLHKGLPLKLLRQLLPLSPSQVMETLFRLEESGLVAQDDILWQVTPLGYPAVRQFLQAGGYLVDQF